MKKALWIVLIFLLSCSKEEGDLEEVQAGKVEGIWIISNQDPREFLDFNQKPGYAIHFHSGEEFILLDDGEGLRIQKITSTQPEGYFLWMDKKGNSWTGIWKEEVVRLIYSQEANRP